MVRYIEKILKRFRKNNIDNSLQLDELKILAGVSALSNLKMNKAGLNEFELKVFSQWGDDGIIQYLIQNLEIKNNTFVEFGVEDYLESNTRFLLMNNNWSGFIMDGSKRNIQKIKSLPWFWKYDLKAECHFVTRDNINQLMEIPNFEDLGILNIDIDGMDYWVWERLDTKKINPSIVIIEYNSVFGKEKELTIPYYSNFQRTKSHYSNLYYGASLKALASISNKKGYVLVGCNNAGNNAYFIRRDLQTNLIKETTIEQSFREGKFRESRNEKSELTFLSGTQKLNLLKGLEIFNLETNSIEKL